MSTETPPLIDRQTDLAAWLNLGVDLNQPIPCEWAGDPTSCPNEATWAGRHTCCPAVHKLCDAHHQESTLNFVIFQATTGVRCMHCDTNPMPEPIWRQL